MKRNAITKQQLLFEMEELRMRLDATEQRLKGANEALKAKIVEHKHTEEALEKTQQYAQSIVETMREPLVVLTADLKVISANHSFYQTFKVSPEGTEGQFIYSVGNHQWDIPLLRKLLEEIVPKNSQFNDFKVDHQFPAIGQRTMLLNARRIYREGKGTEMILLAIEDITERKQTEEALTISETRYRRLFETAQDGILILDADTGQISDVNPFLVEMLGYSHEDVIGKKLWEIGAFKDMEASKAAFSELQNKGYVRYEDLPLETKQGQHIDVEFVSNVYLVDHKNVIQCNIRDITQRHRAEEAVRRANQQISAILNSISDGFFNLDNEFVVNYFNQAAEKSLGRRSEDILGQKLFDAFPEARGSIFEETYKRAMKEKLFTSFEAYFETKPYQNWYEVRVYPHENGMSVYFQVITERKLAEEALQKTHDELDERVKERTAQLMRANEQLIREMEEHKQAEEEKVRQHRRLEGLWKITRNIDADYKALYDMVLVEIIEMTQSRYGFYGFINEDESLMTIHSWSKEAMEICKINDKPIEFPIAKAGLWGEAVRKRKILIVNDYEGDHSGKKGIPEGHVSLSRIMTVPVFSHGRIIALATIGNKPTNYTEEDAEQIKVFATHLQVILERRQAQEALRESEDRLRLLSSQLLTVQENERKQIARDLHDGAGQMLSAIKFKIEDIIQQKDKRKVRLKEEPLEALIPMIRESIEEVRRIQMDLRPSVLDDLGIIATIGWFTREFEKIYSSILIQKKIDILESDVPVPLKIVIYRIIQEALNNIAKHSKGNRVTIALNKKEERVELTVEDNGAGFDLGNHPIGFGLGSMRERVELSMGIFAIESIPGKGTTLRASWPI